MRSLENFLKFFRTLFKATRPRRRTSSKRRAKRPKAAKRSFPRKKAPTTKHKGKNNRPALRKVKAVPAKPRERLVLIGNITHFFSKIRVCVLKVSHHPIRIGDKIVIKGKQGEFKQTVLSLQIESVDVKTAAKGKLVGLKLEREAKPGDKVFKVA